MRNTIKSLPFRRRREAKTNYKKRFATVKSGLDRIVVRRTNKRIIAHVSRYTVKGDQILAYADSRELSQYKWPSRPNKPTAYLLGILLAKKVIAKPELKNSEFILDIGLSAPVTNSAPFVFAKGCVDGGMKVRNGIEVKESLYNYSDTKYVKELKEKKPEAYKRQYSSYIKEGIDAEKLNALFNQVKERILNV